MKTYTWNFDSDSYTFFKRLESKTYPLTRSEKCMHWNEDCFFLKRKSKKNFQIIYHKAYTKNSIIRDLNGKMTETSEGIAVHVTLQMHPAVMIFLSFWFLCMSAAFLIVLFSDPLFSLIPFSMLALGAAGTVIFRGNIRAFISLMDHLYDS